MKPIILLLLNAFFLNACEKGEYNVFKAPANTCLLLKKTLVNNNGRLFEEYVYTYNRKRQKISEKYAGEFVSYTYFYEYNSEGQLIKRTSAPLQSEATYKYENKRLIEERYGDSNNFILIQYFFYNSNGQKNKEIYKSTQDNKLIIHVESMYAYQDTLLVNLKKQDFLKLDKSYDVESVYTYNQAHLLVEKKDLNIKGVFNTEKYEYDQKGNKTKMTKTDNFGNIYEYLYTYTGTQLIEQNVYFTRWDRNRQHQYKANYEYKLGNLVKESTYANDKLSSVREYEYTCASK